MAGALIATVGSGCGPAAEKDINKDKDKPVQADGEGKPIVPDNKGR